MRDARFWGVLILGLLAQALLGFVGSVCADSLNEGVRLAARFSGRFSFLAYLMAVAFLIRWHHNEAARASGFLAAVFFAWVHLLHFGFLAANVVLNGIEPEIPKAIGGALAYVLILTQPWRVRHVESTGAMHAVFVYFAGLVMGLTFLARYRGEFPGAAPDDLHLAGMLAVAAVFAVYTYQRFIKRR